MREQAGLFRERAWRAVRASWTAYWVKSVAFSTAVGLFLGLVGAFGTISYPLVPRLLVFGFIGLGGGLIVAGAVALVELWPWLRARPLLRRMAVAAIIAPGFGVWVWLVIAWMFMKGQAPLWSLWLSIGYSALLTGPMTLLSWLVFRPRRIVTLAAADPPKFVERLPVRLRGGEIYAVEAEDHYLRVHTSQGSDLILLRLSDAIAELEGLEGARVHRSWWVAKAALADVRKGDGRAVLKLKDGAEAPVSRTYLRALREAGWF